MMFSSLGVLNIVNSSFFSTSFSFFFIELMNNSFISWVCKGSFGNGNISILFISSMRFSGLNIVNIVISSLFWKSFSGFDKDSINISSIFFISNGSFSLGVMVKLLICWKIISGFVPSKTISLFLSWVFSGLWTSSIYNDSISCNIKGSFSNPNTLILYISSIIFSGLEIWSIVNWDTNSFMFSGRGVLIKVNSVTNCFSFSGLGIASIVKAFINCLCKGSLSKAIIAILSTWANIFSGLGICSISNSPVFWTRFSGLSIA